MWNLREDQVRTAGGSVHLLFTLAPADQAAVQKRAAELGGERVRQGVLEAAAGSPAVRRLAALQREYRDADDARQAAQATIARLAAERAEAVDGCQPGLGGRLVALDAQAAEARAGAGQGVGALEPLLRAAYRQALAEIAAQQRGASARASAEAAAARSKAIAALAALPELQEALTVLAAVPLAGFAAAGGVVLEGRAEDLLAAALRQAEAAREAEPAPEPAEAEASPAAVPAG